MNKILIGLFSLLVSTQAFAYISVSPGYVNFGNVAVGSNSYVSTIFVINHSAETQYVNVYGYCAEFVVNDYCYSLPPHGSCAITAQMTPRSDGNKYCTINIASRGGFGTATLSGTATQR